MADHDTHDHTGVPGVGVSSGTFNAHDTRHENGGADEISVAGLSGELADPQPPKTHAASHEDGGGDELEVTDLATSEMDDTLVLAPDGAGGVEFRAETGGGGGDYSRLAEFNLAVDTADFDFTSIDGGLRALELFIWGRGAAVAANVAVQLQFNGDTGANYDQRDHGSAGSAAASGQTSAQFGFFSAASATANYASAARLFLPFYDDTSFFKQYQCTVDLPGTQNDLFTGTWKSTTAITRVRLFPASGNWLAGTRAVLYGIA